MPQEEKARKSEIDSSLVYHKHWKQNQEVIEDSSGDQEPELTAAVLLSEWLFGAGWDVGTGEAASFMKIYFRFHQQNISELHSNKVTYQTDTLVM